MDAKPRQFGFVHFNNSITECINFEFVKKLNLLSIAHIADRRSNKIIVSDHFPILVKLGFCLSFLKNCEHLPQ